MAWHKVLLALLISFLFSPLQTQASEQAAFLSNGFLESLHKIARTKQVNIIVNAPDKALPDFKKSREVDILIKETAEAGDCVASKVGNTWLIIARSRHIEIGNKSLTLLKTAHQPIEVALKNAAGFPPTGISVFPIKSANIAVLSGAREVLSEAEEEFYANLKPVRPVVVTLGLDKTNSHDTISLSFKTFTGTTSTLDLNLPEVEQFKANLTVNETLSGNFQLTAICSDLLDKSGKPVRVSSDFKAGKHAAQKFALSSETGSRELEWHVETMTDENPQPSPVPSPKAGQEQQSQADSSHDTPFDRMKMVIKQQPVNEAFAKVIASEEGNLVCDNACTGIVSLFCYGKELYFEELLNLIAKSQKLAVRKIGNTWHIAPPANITDAFDFSHTITRRLQFASAEETARTLQKWLQATTSESTVAIDQTINAVVISGNATEIGNIKNLLAELDAPPTLLNLNAAIQSDQISWNEQFTTPGGRLCRRVPSNQNASTSLDLLPVVFAADGSIGLNYQFAYTSSEGSISLSSWAPIGRDHETPVLVLGKDSPVSLRISAEAASDQLFEPTHSDDENGADPESADAFETSF